MLADLIPLGPTGLPVGFENARLPAIYEKAKHSLSECSRIDECKDWADKSEALASYFKQAHDQDMLKMVRRIQAYALRRCGELLEQVERGKTGPKTELRDASVPQLTRTETAAQAGLSERQRKTVLRLANVPQPEFERAVESENPPTVTQLAEQGKQAKPKPLHDLEGIDPALYPRATELQGMLKDLAAFSRKHDPKALAGAFKAHEINPLKSAIAEVEAWIDRFVVNL